MIAVCIAASSGFIVPTAYQTHLMVFGPGGYRLSDFARAGIPMVLLWGLISIAMIPIFWPLR